MMRQAGEPSVGEILDSIKKVIARDDRAGLVARHEAGLETAEPPFEADDDGVLDLAVAAQFLSDAAGDAPPDPSTAPLVTDESRSAMRQSLAALAMLAEPGASPRIVRSGETSLEGLARELLRPALAQWLDQHLPAIVERLVAGEIARIVGKKP